MKPGFLFVPLGSLYGLARASWAAPNPIRLFSPAQGNRPTAFERLARQKGLE